MKMPYVVGPPVRLPTDFYGRARQTQQFFESLAGPQAQCVSILGLRRAGKTSFLQYISHPEVMATFLPDSQRYLMVYVDLSACKTSGEFYARVYRKLIGGLPRVPAGTNRSPATADVYDVESLLYEFGDRRVVLIMDEFDQLRTADYNDDFMSELRALAGIWDFELSYVTASYWDLYRLGNFVGLPPTSPFYNIFYPSPIYLSGLSPAELEDLVRTPARRVGVVADDEDVAFVRQQAGTLPFYVQVTAAAWLGYKAEGRRPDVNEIAGRLVSELGPYFEQWWRNFDDIERDVVTAVVQDKPVSRLPYAEPEIKKTARRLINYGVIAAAGDHLWSDSALFGRWLNEFSGQAKRIHVRNQAAVVARNGSAAGQTVNAVAEKTLQIVEEVGRQFERLPAIYAPKSDEALRSHLEMALQSGLAGSATGAALVVNGRTGLIARVGGQDVVTIETTSWMGQKMLMRCVDRLVSSWAGIGPRAAIVIFVRNAEFSIAVDAVNQLMPQHSCYLGFAGRQGGRLDFRFHKEGDPQSEILLSVLLFHLPG
ncbi:MAG: hypothetical protein KJ046_00920 [Anaerolineae bacterium]|nr:hypothetical protein [Anaerolineae bacterium]RIK22922.1 MAG: hypothetical protein DCC51_04390 [Anaerolineae bacterium]